MSTDFTGGPGFLAFVVMFALVVATIFLVRSLSAHLRKNRLQGEREEAEAARAAMAAEDAPAGASDDAEGGEGRGDEVTGEAGDR